MWKLVVATGLCALAAAKIHTPCFRKSPVHGRESIADEERPENKYAVEDLPTAMDWRWANETRFTTWTRNQHIPNYCGACWAMGTTSAISDRIMIQNEDVFPEWSLSPQVLLTCSQNGGNSGCHGGDTTPVYQYIQQNGITEETCAPYEATGWDTGNECNDEAICKNCDPDGKCFAQYPHRIWNVSSYGNAVGVAAMKQALQEGPIACVIAVPDSFLDYTGFGIYYDRTNDTSLDHVVSVVGYGEEGGQAYWIGRNSWGTYWGEAGYFRVVAGVNNIGIEEACSYANPTGPVWVNSSADARAGRHSSEKELSPVLGRTKRGGYVRQEGIEREHVVSPLPQEYVDVAELPDTFTWQDVNDTNFLTLARNQHIPTYCGSCWGFGSTSALGDRFNILRASLGQPLWPEINLAVQVLINENGGGTCDGGDDIGVYRYIKDNGIPDETCQVYQARNDPHGRDGKELNICENCVPGNTSATFTPGTCSKVDNFTLYYVAEYGSVSGVDDMKAEIYARGPISCGVDATAAFEAYEGGVFEGEGLSINHIISVFGWGVADDGEAYWHGRNSWGTYWGEEGYFRIKQADDNLKINDQCGWAVPSFTKA